MTEVKVFQWRPHFGARARFERVIMMPVDRLWRRFVRVCMF